jgi:hypothetical protein
MNNLKEFFLIILNVNVTLCIFSSQFFFNPSSQRNSVLSFQSDKKNFISTDLIWIPEPTGEYAIGCDWEHKRELEYVFNKKRSECGSLCLARPGCTRYNWYPQDNGKCVLKDQIPSKFTVFAPPENSIACGIVNQNTI